MTSIAEFSHLTRHPPLRRLRFRGGPGKGSLRASAVVAVQAGSRVRQARLTPTSSPVAQKRRLRRSLKFWVSWVSDSNRPAWNQAEGRPRRAEKLSTCRPRSQATRRCDNRGGWGRSSFHRLSQCYSAYRRVGLEWRLGRCHRLPVRPGNRHTRRAAGTVCQSRPRFVGHGSYFRRRCSRPSRASAPENGESRISTTPSHRLPRWGRRLESRTSQGVLFRGP